MSQQAFDAFTRKAAASVTRRGSLATLGGAGLAALVGASLSADAKDNTKKQKKKAKKKIKQKSFDKCEAQVQSCQEVLPANGLPEAVGCCDLLAVCDFIGFIACANA